MFDPNHPAALRETLFDKAFIRFTRLTAWQLFLLTVLIMILVVALTGIANNVLEIPAAYQSYVASGILVLFVGAIVTGFVRGLLKMFRDSLLKYISGPDALRTMTAGGLENLCMALYEAQGYKVKRRAIFRQPDGGVDLVILKGGKSGLVQCKKWTHDNVGVDKVRELMGVVAREKAEYGVIITTNDFTEAAEKEAQGQIELIAHAKLWDLVEQFRLQGKVSEEQRKSLPLESGNGSRKALSLRRKEIPKCPECGMKLVLRENRNDGGAFLGCAGYSKSGCNFTVPLEDGRKRVEKNG